ncbi:class I SAM-dependent methyltransferase [Achromobacter denitrificans]|uniref:Class I SAM-dependent methyltransferase n=1 Tax=Achromobacter denitrificans TaxID=32002 RepID=A0ABZ3G9S6_ACHDE
MWKRKRVLRSKGYCHCCRSETKFESDQEWLRDHYVCVKCFSLPRQRHVQYVLDNFVPGWESLNVHESSPSVDLIARYCTSYSSSQYLPNTPLGALKDGTRCENLESLTFDDNVFDVFVTQDVLEHVFRPDLATKEIMRVLKPGGLHVFTAPKHRNIPLSYPRAVMQNGAVHHLHDCQYHGSPVGDGKALVTWDYGSDFEYLLGRWTSCPTTTYLTRDRNLGLDGEYLDVFVTRKLTP